MEKVAEYTSPDELLTVQVCRDDEDTIIGFKDFAWHTHGDLLAATYQQPEPSAIRLFLEDLINDRAVIAISRRAGSVVDAWVTEDPAAEYKFKAEDEEIECRYWSGVLWRLS